MAATATFVLLFSVACQSEGIDISFPQFIKQLYEPCPKNSPHKYYVAFKAVLQTDGRSVTGNIRFCSTAQSANSAKWFQEFAQKIKVAENNNLILLNVMKVND